MAFPLTLSGAARVDIPAGCAAPEEIALNGFTAALEKAKATTIQREGSAIVFTVDLLRLVWNANILAPFEGGRIDITREAETIRIRYRLGTARLFILATALMLAMLLLALFKGGVKEVAIAIGIGWGWLFGASYLLALIRFRWFAGARVREALGQGAVSGAVTRA